MTRRDVIYLLRYYRDVELEIKFNRPPQAISEDENFRRQLELLRQMIGELAAAMIDLPYIQRDAVFMHYVQGEKWSRIRRRHYYSDRQMRNISNQGLDALGRRLSDKPACTEILRQKSERDTT